MTQSYRFLIDGSLVPALEERTAKIVDPATESALAEVPHGSERDVDRAVEAAARAFEGWAATPPRDRSAALLKLAERIEAHAEELASIESRNVGKPISLARSEIPFLIDNLRFFAGAARCVDGRAAGEYTQGFTSMLRREPVGVVGSIAPWNYPLMMAVWKIGPALAAGNTVVLKPAEQTPLTALRLGELAADLFPPGVLNVISGDGIPVGAALVAHPKVAMVSLTGDTETGKLIAKNAAATLKRVHLELGGKAPVLVFDDADLDLVVRTLRVAGFANSGQDCTAACRIYARATVFDRLVRDLAPAVASLKTGDLENADTELGPLVSSEQRSRVQGFVDRAVKSRHVEIVTGGHAGDKRGFWFEPTVVAGARQEDEIVQREVFGPVITVTRFDDDDQAIRWANDVNYGLAASVFTTNVQHAMDAARRLRFGTVWINEHLTLVSEMPHGGFKHSGYGSDMSVYALGDYTVPKHVMVRIS